MAGKKPYRKKRGLRTRKPKTKKNTIQKIVKRELHKSIENKQIYNVDSLEITPKMDFVNLFQVIPKVAQGVKQGDRIGNRIKVMSLKLGMTMNMVSEPYAPADTGRCGMYFDIYIFKVIQKPSYDQLVTSADLDYFLQAGGAFNGYVGAPYNWHQNINQDRFNLLYRKRVLMNNQFFKADSTGIKYEAYGQNTNASYSCTIPLTKKVLKNLKYQDGSLNATNDGIYACVVGTRADNIYPTDELFPVGQVNFFSTMVYEDA